VPGRLALAVGIGLAQALFAFTFRGPRARFWQRMTGTGLVLGAYGLTTSQASRHVRIGPREVALGLGSAAVQFATFQVGDRLARRIMPAGDREIGEIYGLRTLRPRGEIAARLAMIVGPAEEIFWRGTVQAGLMRLLGRWPGTAAGVAAYGGVHLVTGNLTLTGAAAVGGAHWGILYAAGVPLGALIVSHSLWDVWIFLLQPTQDPSPARA
jgi:membrane protease YdiL (CAAX protease family)